MVFCYSSPSQDISQGFIDKHQKLIPWLKDSFLKDIGCFRYGNQELKEDRHLELYPEPQLRYYIEGQFVKVITCSLLDGGYYSLVSHTGITAHRNWMLLIAIAQENILSRSVHYRKLKNCFKKIYMMRLLCLWERSRRSSLIWQGQGKEISGNIKNTNERGQYQKWKTLLSTRQGRENDR